MGHSDIGVTLNTYTHLGFDEASEEMRRVSGNWCKNRGCKRNRLAPRFTPFDGRNIGNNADLCKNNEKAQRPEKPLKAAVCGIIRRNERIKKTWLKSYSSATATSLENSGNTVNIRLVEDFSTNITSILHQIWKGIISDNLWKQAYTLYPYLTISSNNLISKLMQRFVYPILKIPYIPSDIQFKPLSYPYWNCFGYRQRWHDNRKEAVWVSGDGWKPLFQMGKVKHYRQSICRRRSWLFSLNINVEWTEKG